MSPAFVTVQQRLAPLMKAKQMYSIQPDNSKWIVTDGDMKIILGLTLLLLISCVSHPVHPPAPLADQKAIKTFKVPVDKVRVIFYMGQYVDSVFNRDSRWPMDIYIGNRKIGNLGQRSDMIAADLSPGTYTFKAVGPDLSKFASKPLKLHIKSGHQYFLKTTEMDGQPSADRVSGTSRTYDLIVSLEQDPVSVGRDTIAVHTLTGYYSGRAPSNIQKKEKSTAAAPVQNRALPAHVQEKATPDLEYKLKKIKSMYEQNLITKEEYDEKRKMLLNSF